MLVNTRGLVLGSLRYSDSSFIARVYTEVAGQRSFMVRVGKGRGALGRMAMLQPLTPVTLAFDLDDRQGLRTPRQMDRSTVLRNIPFDTVRSSIAIFMAEVLTQVLQEETADARLFAFLHEAVLLLDDGEVPCQNLHLVFLSELTRFIGCSPSISHSESMAYFDLREGCFCAYEPLHPDHVEGATKDALADLMGTALADHAHLRIGNEVRRVLLRSLLDYYRLHVHGMRELRSHRVLEEVMA